MSGQMATSILVYPDWLDPNDGEAYSVNGIHFCVTVEWRGEKRYAVKWGSRQLSRAGNWALSVEPFQRHQYRFTFHEALDWAHKVVSGDGLVVNGRTNAEWIAYLAARKQPAPPAKERQHER